MRDLKRKLIEYVSDTGLEERDEARERRANPLPPSREFDRLIGATLALPPCGCDVVGRGTIPFPIRIKFCKRHGGDK